MNNQGTLLVVSGFSGAGKGTVIKELLKEHDNYSLSISATTRKPREGEQDGREYFFKTKEEFEDMISRGRFLEHAQYVNNYYGTPRDFVEEQIKANRNVILKKIFAEPVLVFITPPDADELEKRLRGRGTEDEETIIARLRKAAKESEGVEKYDYIVINDTVKECAVCIDDITHRKEDVLAECSADNADNIKVINQIRQDLKKY
mgnify:CR=1 FL=1